MKKMTPTVKYILLPILSATAALFMSSCNKEENRPSVPVIKPDQIFYGLTISGNIAKYNTMSAETAMAEVTVGGLQGGETILGIDFRPATGELYALGSSSRIYIVNLTTGMARAVNTEPFIPALAGQVAGFDFNPTVDRIRVVTSTGQNLRLNPETGAVAAVDGDINGAAKASVSGVAYTNSVAGASATTLFDLDPGTQKLYKQSPPNNGTLVEVGNLGVMASGEAGFDISPNNSVALASIYADGKSSLFSIDTLTGAATKLGDFSDAVKAIAIPTDPVAFAIDEMNSLLIFNPRKTDAPVSKVVTGLMAGENIYGIDFRPLNGQIFALGSGGNLYTLNAATGAATMVGTGSFGVLGGSYFGFDFNPTVDRIRVVSRNGQNLRLNPITGALAASDGNLNPGSPVVSAVAYTNNFAGATTTTLYDIDCGNDKLYKQMPPNDGTLVEVGPIGFNVESANGFDVGSTSGIAYGIFTVGGVSGVYTVDLNIGAATKVADFATKVKGFTIGLGF